jgi:peptidoglycan/LPS O-acetylase OafA/YrhL
VDCTTRRYADDAQERCQPRRGALFVGLETGTADVAWHEIGTGKRHRGPPSAHKSTMTSTQPRDAAIEQAVAAPPPEEPVPRLLDQPRIAALDGIRGFAILLIIFFHYYVFDGEFARQSIPAYVLSLTRLTWTGIDFFFVLSGFLIGGILLEARESPTYYKTFYIRRAFRILPLYVVIVALHWLTTPFIPPSGLGEPIPAWVYLTLTQNIWVALGGKFASFWLLVTWTIATEEQFYLVAPAMIRKISPARVPMLVAIAIVFAIVLRVVLYNMPLFDPRATLVLMPARADAFMLGIGAAWLVRDPRGARWLRERRRWLYLGALGFGIVLLVFTKMDWSLDSYQMSTFGFTFTSLFYVSLVLLAVSHPEGPVSRFFSLRPLIACGAIAYGLYLFHEPVKDLLQLAFNGPRPRLASWRDAGIDLLAFGFTVVIARLSWIYFERPFVRRGHRHPYWPSESARLRQARNEAAMALGAPRDR